MLNTKLIANSLKRRKLQVPELAVLLDLNESVLNDALGLTLRTSAEPGLPRGLPLRKIIKLAEVLRQPLDRLFKAGTVRGSVRTTFIGRNGLPSKKVRAQADNLQALVCLEDFLCAAKGAPLGGADTAPSAQCAKAERVPLVLHTRGTRLVKREIASLARSAALECWNMLDVSSSAEPGARRPRLSTADLLALCALAHVHVTPYLPFAEKHNARSGGSWSAVSHLTRTQARVIHWALDDNSQERVIGLAQGLGAALALPHGSAALAGQFGKVFAEHLLAAGFDDDCIGERLSEALWGAALERDIARMARLATPYVHRELASQHAQVLIDLASQLGAGSVLQAALLQVQDGQTKNYALLSEALQLPLMLTVAIADCTMTARPAPAQSAQSRSDAKAEG